MRLMGNKGKTRMPRTKEGTLFEAVTALLLVLMWAIIARTHASATTAIPTHFDLFGNADGYGDSSTLVTFGLFGTACALLFTLGAYFPKWLVSMPVRVSTPRQYFLVSRMVRVIGVELVLMHIVLTLRMGEHSWATIPYFASHVAIISTVIFFCMIIKRAGQQ